MKNDEYIKHELDERARLETEARSILDAARAEKRDTTPEEDERYDKLIAEADKRKGRIASLERMAADETVMDQVRSRIGEPADEDSGKPDEQVRSQDQQIVKAVWEAIQAKQHGGEVREVNFGFTIDQAKVRKAEDEIRAIADFSDSASLYVSDFSTRVAVYQRTMSPWISQATVVTADNGRPLILPNLTADGTAFTPGEGTAITESTPTLGTATATPVSYKALSYVSMEAEEDEVVGLMALISRSQGRSLGLAFGSAATTAILAAAGNGGTASGLGGGSTATFMGYEDLLDLKYGLAAPYRLTGAWVMSNGAIKKARKFRTTTGEYLWQPAIAQGQPDLFDGQAVYEDPYLAAPASATKSVVYGDLALWTIKQRPLRVAISLEYRFNTDEVAIKSVYRAGGALADTAGLKYLISANS